MVAKPDIYRGYTLGEVCSRLGLEETLARFFSVIAALTREGRPGDAAVCLPMINALAHLMADYNSLENFSQNSALWNASTAEIVPRDFLDDFLMGVEEQTQIVPFPVDTPEQKSPVLIHPASNGKKTPSNAFNPYSNSNGNRRRRRKKTEFEVDVMDGYDNYELEHVEMLSDEELKGIKHHISGNHIDETGLYFWEMAKTPLLTAEQEQTLAEVIDLGKVAKAYAYGKNANSSKGQVRLLQLMNKYAFLKDKVYDESGLELIIQEAQVARERMAKANTRLVISIAKKYMYQTKIPFLDLIQEGNIGLMRAVDKFNIDKKNEQGTTNRFSTYATWWIRQAVTRALAQKSRVIRVPLHMTEKIRLMNRTIDELKQELFREPRDEEIAIRMEFRLDRVLELKRYSRDVRDLNQPVGDDEDSEFGDFIVDEDSPNPAKEAEHTVLTELFKRFLSELPPRQEMILRFRFGFDGYEPHTLDEIANKFGLSRERIRQLEEQALRRLRHPRYKELRDYLGV